MSNALLDKADGREHQIAVKGVARATSAELTLSTSFQDVITYTQGGVAGSGAWIPVGNLPSIVAQLNFKYGSATTITVQPWGSNYDDGTNGAPVPYIPADADGVAEVFPTQLVYTKATWYAAEGNPATRVYLPLVLKTFPYRYVKFQAKVDSTTGAPTLIIDITGGTQE